MAREQVDHFRAVVRPGDHLVLVAVVAGEGEIALQFLDVEVDADLFPLLLDHFADRRVRNELTADRDQLETQASLPVGAQPIPFAILLGQADLVEQLVGLLQVERRVFLVPFGARAVEGIGRRRYRSWGSHAEPEGFVELVAVDAERERVAEILVLQEFRNLRIAFVGVADVDGRVRSVERRVEVNGVVALLGVLEEDRQLGQAHVPFLDVVFAGDRPQVGDFGVFGQRHRDPVDVGKLVPRGVDGPEVGIPFHRPRRRVDRRHGLPRRHDRQLVVQRPAIPVLEQRYPAVEAEILGLLGDGLLRRILGQELLQVMRRGIGAAEVLESAARREPGADGRAARELRDEEGVRLGKFEGDRVVVDLFHHPVLAVDLELEERRRG